MKKTILVLDAFTNGHEAALSFMKRQGWSESTCDLVFCGTHERLLQRLTEGPAYAVVPVHNIIVGEIARVTNVITAIRAAGYEIVERDRFDLPINHCLMALSSLESVHHITEVFSKEEAIQQCGKYLDSIGIQPEKRRKHDSTGNAAKFVSRLKGRVTAAAIAPRAAASEYGLEIFAEGIQDRKDNVTTFVLLENPCTIRSVTVGIIGISGKFGTILKTFFEKIAGCVVIGSDTSVSTGCSNLEVVQRADVVIFATPIRETPSIVRSLLSAIRTDQLLLDVTSFKQPSMAAMLESGAQVVGLHPMFRPEVSFSGQTIVVCPGRLDDTLWRTWLVNVLSKTGARIKWSTVDEHDRYMVPVQSMPHTANLTNALLIVESGMSVRESLEFTSPFYRVLFSLMGRLINQGAEMYSSIIIDNPGTLTMLEKRIEIEQRLVEMIRSGDHAGVAQLFTTAREHFGSEVTAEANELFMRLLGVLNTLYGSNAVTLECSTTESRPGLLGRILNVFSQRNVNLTGINSVSLPNNRLQFAISFEQPRSSHSVRRALEEIEGWSEPIVTVIM